MSTRTENPENTAKQRIFATRVKKGTELDLSGLGLTLVPQEILTCTELRKLDLSDNNLTEVSPRLSRLTHLKYLSIANNSIPYRDFNIEALVNLYSLDASGNPIEKLDGKFSRLKLLRKLTVSKCSISKLTDEFCSLSNLQTLNLSINSLEHLPESFGHLNHLDHCDLSSNHLSEIPDSIGNIETLVYLNLSNNSLQNLPNSIGSLEMLRALNLTENPIKALPSEVGRIRKLMELALPVDQHFIPPDVTIQGTPAVLAYLRSFLDENAPIYPRQAKLVLVGQGNSGKTCLVNNLLAEPADGYQGKTEGVEVRQLILQHPIKKENMVLSVWDFGGQEIQHATHQFFLTNRSIFLLVYNARQDVGKRGGNIQYWLEMIQSRAPDSPVFLIATHCDQEPARISVDYWKDLFPNIKDIFQVGNKSGKGIDEVRDAIQECASGLSVIDEAWNRRWLDARNSIKELKQSYIQPSEAWGIMAEHGVEHDEMPVVAGRMHLLGDIVYFRENAELKDTIILNPEWLTKRVCQAVSSDVVQSNYGVMTGDMLEEIWPDESTHLREELLRFMEQYDLSYRTTLGRQDSIVVQALPDSPTTALWETWNRFQEYQSLHLRYRFKGTLPPGIPSWFIAREHRFTKNLHWRYGAVLQDRNGDHRALVSLTETAGDLNVYLGVRGPEPVRFFSILQDGFEETIARYPGLEVKRVVPCKGMGCSIDSECEHEYGLEELEKYREKGIQTIRCGSSLVEYSVVSLLYGITVPRVEPSLERFAKTVSREIVEQIDDKLEATEQKLNEILSYQQREFTKVFTMFQSQDETQSPSVFIIEPPRDGWTRKAFGVKLKLRLCCEMPGCWHPLQQGIGEYEVNDPAKWMERVAPHFRRLVQVLKVGVPLAHAITGYAWKDIEEMFKQNWTLAEELSKILPEIDEVDDFSLEKNEAGRATGVALAALREVLTKDDPYFAKSGLEKVLMPEKNYLWLCKEHAQEVKDETRLSLRSM